jgi:hypothetical protein
MSFFDRFFAKKEKRREIKEEELEGFLEEKISQVWRETPSDFKPENIKQTIQRVLEKVELLDNAEEEGEIHKRLAAISKSTRDNVCVVTKKEVESIPSNSLKEFYVQAGKALENVGNVTSKYDERVKIAYQSQYVELWKELKELYSHYNSVEEFAKNALQEEKKFRDWLGLVKAFKETKKEVYALDGRIIILTRDLDEERTRLGLLKKEINEFENSKDFTRYTTSKKRIKELSIDVEQVKRKFETVINTLRKPLYYYKNKVADSQEKMIVERMVDEQGEFMHSKTGLDNANLILTGIKRSVGSGRIQLSEKRSGRVLSVLERGVDDLFKKFEELVLLVEEEKRNVESSHVQEQINRLKKESKSVKERIARQNTELVSLKERLEDKKNVLGEEHEKVLKIKRKLEK